MKILFHINSMGRGGAEHVVSILSSFFAQKGHTVVIATQWKAENEYRTDPRVRREHVGLNAADEKKGRITKILLRYARLRQCVKKERPDIAISFCNKANFRSALAMTGMRIPLLVSVRNDPKRDYAPYALLTKIMEYKAAGCVFQTPDAKAFFSESFQKKSRIILNPLSDQYTSLPEQVADRRKKVIVTVGRITQQKNQMLLLRAFADICEEFTEYRLKIYGAADDRALCEDMETFISRNGLAGRVSFMGAVDNLPEEIMDASLFVLPSDYEGMPNALIEAMVMGLPCIATDCPCGGPAMLIQDRVSGLLVPVGDEQMLAGAMRYMLSDRQSAEKMGQAARALKEKVAPERVCEEWQHYIDQIVEGRISG